MIMNIRTVTSTLMVTAATMLRLIWSKKICLSMRMKDSTLKVANGVVLVVGDGSLSLRGMVTGNEMDAAVTFSGMVFFFT